MASPNRHVDYFHDFPEDIVRTILEAATSDTDEPSWACARVSRKVQGWTEPILYRHIRVEHTSASAILLARTVNSHPAKPAPFFATYVKSLFIDFWDGKEPTTIISILGACPNIVELHFSTSYLGEPFLVGKHSAWKGFSKLERLRIAPYMFSRSHFTFISGPLENPMFAFLTHLELPWDGYRLQGQRWNLPSFSSLQALTHMCLAYEVGINPLGMFVQVRSWVPHIPTQLMVFALRTPHTLSTTNHHHQISSKSFLLPSAPSSPTKQCRCTQKHYMPPLRTIP
ncbi:hypothetical protein D9611_011360 [Ephemerocybe angulata]|uniref:Uncharacterized protein n=1 Tax=Ephemerocybe angulata TaxID=980116 RepID=A0A8H5BDK6_9AGAR|nr:hypothetical protein D9611_011360 [Tulosesus angulatus]